VVGQPTEVLGDRGASDRVDEHERPEPLAPDRLERHLGVGERAELAAVRM